MAMGKQLIQYRLGELFCGPGGLSLGAAMACIQHGNTKITVTHEWASDYDEDACQTIRANLFADHWDRVFCADVRELDLLKLGPIDIFAYGFPCNDFSIVGEQKGFEGNYGPLYSYGVEVLNNYKPLCFIAENVSGLVSANEGNAFRTIIHDLAGAGSGYKLTAHLYSAEDYGVAQYRKRIIIVGIAEELEKTFKVPAPSTAGHPVSARDAIENPPILPGMPNCELTRQSAPVIERLRHIKPGENAWNANLPAHLRLNVTGAKLSQIYRRIDPDLPAYTITGSGGGGTHVYHWSEPRALTNRERARLQSFPDDFIFYGSKESVRRQIGMAVPPKLSQAVFTALLKTLEGIDYEAVPANISIDSLQMSPVNA